MLSYTHEIKLNKKKNKEKGKKKDKGGKLNEKL